MGSDIFDCTKLTMIVREYYVHLLSWDVTSVGVPGGFSLACKKFPFPKLNILIKVSKHQGDFDGPQLFDIATSLIQYHESAFSPNSRRTVSHH